MVLISSTVLRLNSTNFRWGSLLDALPLWCCAAYFVLLFSAAKSPLNAFAQFFFSFPVLTKIGPGGNPSAARSAKVRLESFAHLGAVSVFFPSSLNCRFFSFSKRSEIFLLLLLSSFALFSIPEIKETAARVDTEKAISIFDQWIDRV